LIRGQLEPHLRRAGIRPTARAIGVDHAVLHRWLAGSGTLRDHHVEALCRQLGLTLVVRPYRAGRRRG